MTSVQSTGTGNAGRTAEPKKFRQIAKSTAVITPFEGRAGIRGAALTSDDLHELVLLDEFFANHVRRDGLRDVQCMLLWSEWVRIFQRQTRMFPRFVLEKEFRENVMNRLGVDIAHDEMRGAVFPGLRFVP